MPLIVDLQAAVHCDNSELKLVGITSPEFKEFLNGMFQSLGHHVHSLSNAMNSKLKSIFNRCHSTKRGV
jgi:hypothetical protein